MRLPNLEGLVERRLLVNYRVDPEVATRLLPSPFRLQLVNGWAVAGICLIRLVNCVHAACRELSGYAAKTRRIDSR